MPVRGLLASPLGFLIGLSLGALGGGGSILAVPALVYGAGQDPREATTSSLLLVGVAAVVGLRPHLRAGRVLVATGAAIAVAGIPGSVAGTALNHRLDADVLLLGFSALMFVAAWRMLTGCPTCTKVGEAGAMRPGETIVATRVGTSRMLAIGGVGLGIGFLTGLFGIGGGFVIVPALTLLLRLNMPAAMATSLLVIAMNSGVGLGARLGTSTIEWSLTLPFAAAAIAGVLTGGALADRLDPRRALRWFATLLVVVGAYTAFDALTG
jgi:uncharacterized protein